MTDLRGRTIVASGFHAPERGLVEELQGAVIAVDSGGTITSVTDGPAPPDALHLPAGSILLPGFVDLHIHAPQYPQAGLALDAPLEDWLHRHTFPLEARYSDLAFAGTVYRALVADLLAAGTTTALYFATIHPDATCLLADICLELGQRALVGKVAMDHPDTCPDYYRDADADAAVTGTRTVIDHIRAHPGNAAGLVQPVVTPRFIPACTDAALAGLGRLAHDTGCRVQSHVSESDWEHGHVLARMGSSDAASLDAFGLLRPGSVMAHGNFLSGPDMDMLRDRQTAVAHCPHSNAWFAGAVFPLRAALERGLRVGLGSDISGGPATTIWDAARMAVASSRMLESGTDAARPPDTRGAGPARIDMATAFHLATAGGGAALGLPVGSFRPGQQFDALMIDPAAAGGGLRIWPGQTGLAVLEKVMHGAGRANIAAVWVAGRLCAGFP